MKKRILFLACLLVSVCLSAGASALTEKIESLKLIDSDVDLSTLIQFEVDLDDSDDVKDNDGDLDIEGEISTAKGYSGYYAISRNNKITQCLIITVKDDTDNDVDIDVEFLDIDEKGKETAEKRTLKVQYGKEYDIFIRKDLSLGLTPVKRKLDKNGKLDGKVSAVCDPASGAVDSETQLHSTHTWMVENKTTIAQMVDIDLELWVDWDGDGVKDLDEDDTEFDKDILIAPLSKVTGSKDMYLKVTCAKKGTYKFFAETELDDFDSPDQTRTDNPDTPDDFDIEIISEGLLVVN